MKNFKKISISTVLALIFALLLVCSLQTASAANQTIDSNNITGIKGAIDTAFAGDTVFLQTGTYNKSGIDNNFTISKNITIQGNGSANSIIIDAQGQRRIAIGSGFNVAFINITFRNFDSSGYLTSPGVYVDGYGGVISTYSPITFINCIFENNTASIGGAICIYGGSVDLINSTFTNNIGSSHGGAVAIYGGTVGLINCTFTNNRANGTSSAGGAVFIIAGTVGLINSTFTNNRASTFGGAIYNRGNLNLSGNIMNGNTAGSGQMIYNEGNIGIVNLTYLNNETKNGVYNQNIILYATLADDMGNTIAGQNVSFYVNGEFVGNVTVIGGNASLTYTIKEFGLLLVTGDYGGRGLYAISTSSGQLLVPNPNPPTNLTIPPVPSDSNNPSTKIYSNSTINVPKDIRVGKTINITGTLKDGNGKHIIGARVSVTVDGKTYTLTTDSKGQWILSYKPSRTGNVNVLVSYLGDDSYLGSENKTSFNVRKGKVNIVTNVVKNPDGSITITANVTDENGDPLSGKEITLRDSKGKVLGFSITDQNGKITFTYKGNSLYVKLSFDGDDPYNGVSVEITNPNPQSNNPSKETSNAAMKNTGVPAIIVLLAILAVLRLFTHKKQN